MSEAVCVGLKMLVGTTLEMVVYLPVLIEDKQLASVVGVLENASDGVAVLLEYVFCVYARDLEVLAATGPHGRIDHPVAVSVQRDTEYWGHVPGNCD